MTQNPLVEMSLFEGNELIAGIGGTGNKYIPSETEEEEAREHNKALKTKTVDGEDMRKKTGGLSIEPVLGLAGKGKGKLLGD